MQSWPFLLGHDNACSLETLSRASFTLFIPTNSSFYLLSLLADVYRVLLGQQCSKSGFTACIHVTLFNRHHSVMRYGDTGKAHGAWVRSCLRASSPHSTMPEFAMIRISVALLDRQLVICTPLGFLFTTPLAGEALTLPTLYRWGHWGFEK